jgi:hypothetical protein
MYSVYTTIIVNSRKNSSIVVSTRILYQSLKDIYCYLVYGTDPGERVKSLIMHLYLFIEFIAIVIASSIF